MSVTLKLGGVVVLIALSAAVLGLLVLYVLGEPARVKQRVQKRTSALQDLAYRDSLTGLPNRRFFTWYLEQNLAMRMTNRRRGSHVNRVVLFDLNGFKAVNDTYGHEAGDELLKFIAVTMTAYLPSDALLARLGGDEFVVMVRDNRGGRRTREVEATIRKAATSVFVFGGQQISVSASVGSSSPATGRSTAEQLLRESDQRMYADKVAGRAQRAKIQETEGQNAKPTAIERRKNRASELLSKGDRR
ncbi:GGDEF domain-containing protein [Granulosicoccus antarcticus]|nr:GGDEF domain-containing protein [Granulosicoccus antarcticus]